MKVVQDLIRDAIFLRYELHHYWYTTMYLSSTEGTPTMRPLWYEFPHDPSFLVATDAQFMVGESLVYVPKLESSNNKASDLYDPTTIDNK